MKLFDIIFIIDDGERQNGFDVRKVIQVVIQKRMEIPFAQLFSWLP